MSDLRLFGTHAISVFSKYGGGNDSQCNQILQHYRVTLQELTAAITSIVDHFDLPLTRVSSEPADNFTPIFLNAFRTAASQGIFSTCAALCLYNSALPLHFGAMFIRTPSVVREASIRYSTQLSNGHGFDLPGFRAGRKPC